MSSVPWFQQPSYTGNVGGIVPAGNVGGIMPAAMVMGLPFGMAPQAHPGSTSVAVLPPPEPEVFYCDPCEKEFKVESQYKAHLATHVTCQMPGCNFSASQRVVKEHISTAHGDGGDGGTKKILNLDTPEEIEKWREARRKNWPSASNIKRKQEQAADREVRGDAPVEEPKRKRGPNWRIEMDNPPRKGNGRGTGDRPGGGQDGKGERGGVGQLSTVSGSNGLATQEEADEEEEKAPAPVIEAGLFACYESSDDDGPPHEKTAKCQEPPARSRDVPPNDDNTASPAGAEASASPQRQAPSAAAGAGQPRRSEGGAGAGAGAGAGKQAGGRPRKPCIYFARGRCNKGARCTFAHVAAGSAAGTSGDSAAAACSGGAVVAGNGGGSSGQAGAGGRSINKGYLPHSSLKRSGPSLLDKLTKKDSDRQQRILLQCFRHLIVTGQVPT